jgi:hypothetical protein
VRRADPSSKKKVANILRISHRDEVEAPVTDWLQEAYELSDVLAAKTAATGATSKPKPRPGSQSKAARKTSAARKSKRR